MMNSSTKLLLLATTLVAVASVFGSGAPTAAQSLHHASEGAGQSRRTPRQSGQTPAAQTRLLAIRNVTVIPGTGSEPIRNATVLIRDERIVAIGPAAETVVPAGARVVEGAGKFLLPGFREKSRTWFSWMRIHSRTSAIPGASRPLSSAGRSTMETVSSKSSPPFAPRRIAE